MMSHMVSEFELKAKRYEDMLDSHKLDKDTELSLLPHPEIDVHLPVPDMVALMVMKADATAEGSSFASSVVDHTVQYWSPNPSTTHVELWVGDRSSDPSEDNHFSTYLGAEKGARWTSGMSDSKKFYSSASWSAIPICAHNVERSVRGACNVHCETPYPSAALLWQYPMSVWPLRAFSGFMDDRPNSPAHCAALTARVLRGAIFDLALPHSSHWYGPSSLYLELSQPVRMEAALALQRPVVRSTAEEEQDDYLSRLLTRGSDETVASMSREDARHALRALANGVLQAGSRQPGVDVDQDDFREAQEMYAKGLIRYTWINRLENNR